MTAAKRQIISALLSLLLVLSGSALAVPGVSGGQSDSVMVDCGSIMMSQADGASSSPDSKSDCVVAPGVACLSAGGLSKCGVSVALLLAATENSVDSGSQPLSTARVAIYQNPFLASITPPPLSHS